MSDKTNNLAKEISAYYAESIGARNQWYFIERMLQLIDREKIVVLNRYRKQHDEPLLVPEPTRYPTTEQRHIGWIIDVPKPWISLVSKDKQS